MLPHLLVGLGFLRERPCATITQFCLIWRMGLPFLGVHRPNSVAAKLPTHVPALRHQLLCRCPKYSRVPCMQSFPGNPNPNGP